MFDRGDGRYIFDLGQNMSGYIRLTVDERQAAGDVLDIHYAEKLDDNGEMNYFNMGNHYKESDFAHDRFLCDGKSFVWSPKFAYHGFRYIEVTGLKNPDLSTVSGVFVHQAVKARSSFECSDDFLNSLFRVYFRIESEGLKHENIAFVQKITGIHKVFNGISACLTPSRIV
jgi:alpha-L-rhamnosidase